VIGRPKQEGIPNRHGPRIALALDLTPGVRPLAGRERRRPFPPVGQRR